MINYLKTYTFFFNSITNKSYLLIVYSEDSLFFSDKSKVANSNHINSIDNIKTQASSSYQNKHQINERFINFELCLYCSRLGYDSVQDLKVHFQIVFSHSRFINSEINQVLEGVVMNQYSIIEKSCFSLDFHFNYI